jgi:hypothetical protein
MNGYDQHKQDAFAAMVARDAIFGNRSAAYGWPVTSPARGNSPRYFVGVIVDVSESRESVWVRRYTDPADVSVLYSVRELEPATKDDMATAASYFLNQQYREVQDLQARVAREQADLEAIQNAGPGDEPGAPLHGIEQYQSEGR